MMRCIAIDDEPLALTQIAGYIERTPFLQLTAACRSAPEAGEYLASEGADIMFVDIHMPDLNGLDFVRSLSPKPIVVFTTAYSEYALEGFRVDAFDYLLKPVDYAAFLRSAEKARRQFELLKGAAGRDGQGAKHIFVRSEYKTIAIDPEAITHIESRSEYVRISTETGKPVMTLGSLKAYEEKLPPEGFMRVHRSYIVNLKKISAVERRCILLGDGTRIPIGGIYERRFREYLGDTTPG